MFYGRDYISYRSDPENQIPKGRVGEAFRKNP